MTRSYPSAIRFVAHASETLGSELFGRCSGAGNVTRHRTGSLAASPATIASPVLSTGSRSTSPPKLSGKAPFTRERSSGLERRRAKIVPHCDKMVSSTSEGRWETTIAPIPYLRPSLAMRLTISAAGLLSVVLERYRCASSITTNSGRSIPPSVFSRLQYSAS